MTAAAVRVLNARPTKARFHLSHRNLSSCQMPTYEFKCPAGHEFEKFYRKISDSVAVLPCPVCGLVGARQMSAGAGLVFKGSGFYITDYGKDGKKGQGGAKSGGDSGGEGKGGDGKSSEGKSSEGKSSEGKSSEGKRGEGKGGEIGRAHV